MPGANDIPVMRALARAGLRPLLEAGVRVFEWNGSMMHSKTAVADGRWSRVGSTNLNIASWLNNRELDLIVEDERFARQMEDAFLDDLSKSTEIVLETSSRRPVAKRDPRDGARKTRAGSAPRTAAGVLRLTHVVGAAIRNRRELGPAEAVILFWASIVLILIAAVAAKWPRAVAIPAAVTCIWISISLLLNAYRLRRRSKTKRRHRDEAA